MRAILIPNRQDPRITDELVECLSRKAGGMVLVSFKGRMFSVDQSRLRSEGDRARRLTQAEIDTLPWSGKGKDPAGQGDLLVASS